MIDLDVHCCGLPMTALSHKAPQSPSKQGADILLTILAEDSLVIHLCAQTGNLAL